MSIHRHITRALGGACTLAALAAFPAMSVAQEAPALDNGNGPFFLAVNAGAALPGAELNDLADTGFTLGGELGWQATDRVAFKLDGAADMLRDQPVVTEGPEDMRLFHYGAGLEVMLTQPDPYRAWDVAATLGAGATTLDADLAAPADPNIDEFTETYPNANAGLTVSFQPASSVVFELSGEAFVAFADKNETALLTSGMPGIDPLNRAVTYPVTLAIDWYLPST